MRSSRLFGLLMAVLALVLVLGVYFLLSGLTLGDAPLQQVFAPRYTL